MSIRNLSTIRLSLWNAAIVCSMITLGLAADWLSHTIRPATYRDGVYVLGDFYDTFIVVAIATSALTLLTLPAFIAIDIATDKMRSTPPTSMIMVEMLVVTILWILWLATASLTVHYAYTYFWRFLLHCSRCHKYKSIEAFSIIAWLCLMGYDVTLLIFTVTAYSRGQTSVWSQSVKRTNFFGPRASALSGTPAAGFVDSSAEGFTPAPQSIAAGSPCTVPCMLVVVPQQFQQPQYQLLFPHSPFPQSLFPQSPLPLQPFQLQPLQQQQVQQPPPQDGGSAPAGPTQPLQPLNTISDVQPEHHQV